MSSQRAPAIETHRVLIVDDEPDIHAVTKLALKGLTYGGRKVELLTATSGAEAVAAVRSDPGIAAILLDVVMETNSAGLEACKTIRQDLGNRLVRIVLRTGQPGVAPERETIESYDIDGYLAKTDANPTKLYCAIRTALKAHGELMELERHRRLLSLLHDSAVSLHSFDPLETTLRRILSAAGAICPTPLAMLDLETFEEQGNPRRFFLHFSSELEGARAEALAIDLRGRIRATAASRSGVGASRFEQGFLVPLSVHRELGHGFIYVQQPEPDEIVKKTLELLAAHTANALYSQVAQANLAARQGPVFDAMQI